MVKIAKLPGLFFDPRYRKCENVPLAENRKYTKLTREYKL